MSHKESFEVTKFAQYLSTIYGEKLKVHRLNIHDYLGMDLYYLEPGLGKLSMVKYLQKVLDKFPEYFRGMSSTPESDHMFQTRG